MKVMIGKKERNICAARKANKDKRAEKRLHAIVADWFISMAKPQHK